MTTEPTSPLVERLRAWSYRQQFLGRAAEDALAALRRVVGVYSSHPSGPLTLHARTDLSAAGFAALERDKLAVRIVGMRGSAFLVPLESADRIAAATRRSGAWSPGELRARGLDERTFAALRPRVMEAAAAPITPIQLRRALGAEPGDQRPYFTMRLMAREGLVVRVGTGRVRTDDLRWVATEAWLGRPLGAVDARDALAWLARAYLDGYGPARLEDFAWWAGVPRRGAREAIETVETVEVAPGLLLPATQRPAWEACPPVGPDAVDVLPKWDAYEMGHAPDGRARLLDDVHLSLAFTTGATRVGATAGDGLPLLVRAGRAAATWSHRLDGRRMAVTVRPFDLTAREARDLVDLARPAFERVAELFGAEVSVSLDA